MTLHAALAAIRAALREGLDGPGDAAAREVLRETDRVETLRPRAQGRSAATRHLAALATPDLPDTWRGVLAALQPVLADLDWHFGYAAHTQLARDVAFANLVGPGGPLVCRPVRLGLTLMGPHILYPDHLHPAVEFYVVLSGTAAWAQAGLPFAEKPPGASIFHESGIIHAMRTQAEPLLALFGWTGDVETPPIFVQ